MPEVPANPQSARGPGTGSAALPVFLRNSLANVAGGVATALLSLAVPPVVARHLPPPQFSAWMLVLQLVAYTGLLNLGIQGATSRYVAHYLARNDRGSASAIVSTACAALAVMALIAALLVVLAAMNLGVLFPALPASLVGPSANSLLLIGITTALLLPAEAIAGSFTGVQRNGLVALIQGSARALLALTLVAIVAGGGTAGMMAVAFATTNMGMLLAYGWTSRRLGIVELSWRHAHWRQLREIWAYSSTMLVWIIGMFFINGFDTAIVARLEFTSTGVYSACFGPVLLIAGLQQALFGPLLQLGAARQAGGAAATLPALLLRSTRLSTLVLLFLSVPLAVFSRDLLAAWLGPADTAEAQPIFLLLLGGNTLRLIATPYALLLLATLQHRRLLVGPVAEACVNVTVAVTMGLRFGAAGVACGIVAGALVGLMVIVGFNAPRTPLLVGDLRALLWKGVFQPVSCALPALATAAAATGSTPYLPDRMRIIGGSVALLVGAVLAWRYCIDADEKAFAGEALRRLPGLG